MKLSIESCPSRAQLDTWWETMATEDLSRAFNDDFPHSVELFLELCARGLWNSKCIVDGCAQVAAMVWLHDITYRHEGSDRLLDTGWLGGYYMPDYRGRLGIQPIELAMLAWRFRGLRHLFAAVHAANGPSQRVLKAYPALEHVATCLGPTLFRGKRCTLCIYATPGGADLAMDGIEARWAHEREHNAQHVSTTIR